MENTMNTIREELTRIATYDSSSLKMNVALIALDHIDEYEDPEEYFVEVLKYGCGSGMVIELITYKQTDEFFNTYADEIFDLYNELKANIGEIDMELSKNNLAWLGFEETLRNIADELGIDW